MCSPATFHLNSVHLFLFLSVCSSVCLLFLCSALSWSDIDWLRSVTTLPIVVKGMMTAKDAVLAVQHGVAGVWVSNHGARQLDTSPATVNVNALHAEVRGVARMLRCSDDGGAHRCNQHSFCVVRKPPQNF